MASFDRSSSLHHLPDSTLLPHLSFTATINKHLSSASAQELLKGEGCSRDGPRMAREIAAALATASIQHLAFARGLVSTTFAQLQKQGASQRPHDDDRPSRRSSHSVKRDHLLSSVSLAQRHIFSAIQAASGASASVDHLPLFLVIGSSPLSPREIYYLDIRTTSSNATSIESDMPLPLSSKLLSTSERQLIRFLISTEEISNVIMTSPLGKGGGRMSLFLFTLRGKDWRAPGWRIRRGLKLNLQGLRTLPQVSDDEYQGLDDEESVSPNLNPPTEYSTTSQTRSAYSPHHRGLDRSRPSTPASHASLASGQTESPCSDLTTLAEALSPARRIRETGTQADDQSGNAHREETQLRRPLLIARQSSYADDRDVKLPPTYCREEGPCPAPTATPVVEGDHSGSPSAPLDEKENASSSSLRSGSCHSTLIEPLQSLSLDPRPPGSRLFPTNIDLATSLLARSRLGSSSSSTSSTSAGSRGASRLPLSRRGGTTDDGANEGPVSRPSILSNKRARATVKGRAPPRGAGFVLDCSIHPQVVDEQRQREGELSSGFDAADDEASGGREDRSAGRRGEVDDEDEELVLFQCEVAIPSFQP